MKVFISALVLVAAAFAGVHAQSTSDTATGSTPTDISGISPCILTCITQSATANGCSGLTDVNCFCTNTNFQSQTLSCLQSNCTADDLTAATALQQAQCANVAPSGSNSPTTTSGASPSNTAPSNSSNTAAGPSPTNAASSLKAGFVAAVGAVAGAALVL